MPSKSTFEESAKETASAMGDKVSDMASQVKEKVSDLGQTAAQKIDQNRDKAASGMENAASTLHTNADRLPGGEKVTGMVHDAADRLNSTAEYVREHNMNAMVSDVERLVKNNPGPALITAAFVGFLVGRAFTNND